MQIKLEPAIEIDSLAANLHLVRSGSDFVTVLPLSIVKDDVTAGVLCANPIVEPPLERHISFARRSGDPLNAAAARYATMFAERLTLLLDMKNGPGADSGLPPDEMLRDVVGRKL